MGIQMKYYKDQDGSVYAYESAAERDRFGSDALVLMTNSEVDKLLNQISNPYKVPESVTMRKARLALLGAGLLDDVEAALTAMGDTAEGKAARIEWAYSSEVWRNKPFVVQLGTSLGLSDEDIDELFITAATL